MEIRLGLGMYEYNDPFLPTHFSTDKNQCTKDNEEHGRAQNKVCCILNEAMSQDTTTDEEQPDNDSVQDVAPEAQPWTSGQEEVYRANIQQITRMDKNYNRGTTFNMASLDFIARCLEIMDPVNVTHDNIKVTRRGEGLVPTKSDLLNIFEFCTDIPRDAPSIGNVKTTTTTFDPEVKTAIIALTM
eukprot:7243534-Heterocapsa_arctica.AAC.1